MKNILSSKRNVFNVAISLLLSVAFVFTCGAFKTFTARAADDEEVTPATFGVDYATFEEEQAAAEEFNIKLAEESFTLLKNDGTLPIIGEAVSVFGTISDNLYLGGGGSGGGSAAAPATVRMSLEAAGFRLNPELLGIYAGISGTEEPETTVLARAEKSYRYYSDAAIIVIGRTGSEFSDAPLYNVAGHSDPQDHTYSLTDNEKDLIDYVGARFNNVIVVVNSAHPIELGFVEDHAKVGSVLWMGHPGKSGAMALGRILNGTVNPSGRTVDVYPAKFASDPTWANFKGNVQSHLAQKDFTVGTGNNAVTTARAYMANLLPASHDDAKIKAHYNESGAFVNVYYDTDGNNKFETGTGKTDINLAPPVEPGRSAPAEDFLEYSRLRSANGAMLNTDGPNAGGQYFAMLDYEEGIYMGYRWYETADAEGYFANEQEGYYNRNTGVVYPFGHGLSYTNFVWDVVGGAGVITLVDEDKNDDITIQVQVTNTGTMAGKDVIQVYWSPVYTAGEIEKAAVNLVGFAKTGIIQPNQSQIVEVTFNTMDLASFDYLDDNNNQHAGYEIEEGGGTLSLRRSSHIIGRDGQDQNVVITVSVADDIIYTHDPVTGTEIETLFTGDGTWDGTRSDNDYYDSRYMGWMNAGDEGTDYWSREYFKDSTKKIEAPTVDELKLSADAEMILLAQTYFTSFNDLPTDPWYKGENDIPDEWTQAASRAAGEKTDIQLYEMSGVPLYDDNGDITEEWVEFMNQLTYAEMVSLISSNSFRTPALDSIGKPASNDRDGPAQLSGGTFWVCEVNIASTYNIDLAHQQGVFVGNESLFNGVQGWYGPGLNVHRNPIAGRNFEYYSQDGIQGGIMAAAVISGARSKGIVTYMKHLFLNDQETSRYTAHTFVTEQALREQYAKVWEIAIKVGGANASMTAFNRVGLISTNSHYNLYQRLLCDEWGFNASSVTDMFGWNYTGAASGDMGARTGVTPLGSWNNTFGRNVEGTWDATKGTVVVEFTQDITDGQKWTVNAETGALTNTAYNAANPGNINDINKKASRAFKTPTATTTLKQAWAATGSNVYAKGDKLDSYTQWYAVRTTATKLLYVQSNANTMKNGVLTNPLTPSTELKVFKGVNANVAITKDTAALTGHTASYRLVSGTLPAGVTINTTNGNLTGATSAPIGSTYTFSVGIAVDNWIGAGGSNSNNHYAATYTVTVVSPLAVDKSLDIQQGEELEAKIGAAQGAFNIGNNSPTCTIIEGALPAGVTLATDGTLAGTPTQSGTFEFTVNLSYTQSSWGGTTTYNYSAPFTMNVEAVEVPPPVVTKFDVTFNVNYDGGANIVKSVVSGEKVDMVVPVRADYIFAGWFTDKECTTAADLSGNVTAAKTVYAKWVSVESTQTPPPSEGGCGSEITSVSAPIFFVTIGGLLLGLIAVSFVFKKREENNK